MSVKQIFKNVILLLVLICFAFSQSKKVKILITNDPNKAASLADCIMTDKWISMGDKVNKKKKKKLLYK